MNVKNYYMNIIIVHNIPLEFPGECIELGTVELFGVEPPGMLPDEL